MLEDCISVNFNDDFGSFLRDGVHSQLDTKRLYKLVHIVLFGFEASLQVGGKDQDSGASPPAKRGGGRGKEGKAKTKNGKEFAIMIEQSHLLKVCVYLKGGISQITICGALMWLAA